jgi:hypothetical protein
MSLTWEQHERMSWRARQQLSDRLSRSDRIKRAVTKIEDQLGDDPTPGQVRDVAERLLAVLPADPNAAAHLRALR